MARVSDISLLGEGSLGLTLDRYAELLGLDMCAFNGINRPTERRDNQCIDIVTQSQRDQLALYLLQAEQKREQELTYHLHPKYRAEELSIPQAYNPFILSMKYLIEVGYPTYTLISAGIVLNHGLATAPNDPVVITVTTTAPVGEIVVTYPGEYVHITSSSVSKTGNVVAIRIPRCRLVNPAYDGDWDDPYSYYDNTPFLATVDVYRYWSDPSLGAQYVWMVTNCNDTDCSENCQQACTQIVGDMAKDLSIVHVYPATYASGIWTKGCFSYCTIPDSMRITYKSGVSKLDDDIYTIRLAHTLMPRPPCSCDIVKQKWTEDREVVERTFTPYGSMRGAIDAWVADSHNSVGRGGMFPGFGAVT